MDIEVEGRTVKLVMGSSGCWVWTGPVSSADGFVRPIIYVNRKLRSARMLVWDACGRPPIGKLRLRNECRNERCVNPDHQALVRAGTDGRTYAEPPRTHWFETNERGCWIWTGKTSPQGYGTVRGHGMNVLAHRLAYEMAYGPFPPELDVLHRCDNPPCCNPEHLRLGTARDNARDMAAKLRGPNKLDYGQAEFIRWLREAGYSFRRIAAKFGVTHRTIMKICSGKTYNYDLSDEWVTPPISSTA